jgi:hypothetical protein
MGMPVLPAIVAFLAPDLLKACLPPGDFVSPDFFYEMARMIHNAEQSALATCGPGSDFPAVFLASLGQEMGLNPQVNQP